MARTNKLSDFLTDVADAIRSKKGSQDTISASQFDTEILGLPSGTYQTKTLTINANGSQTVTPDQGYDAIDEITITTQVPQKQLQSKTYNFTTNQTIELLPDTGYDGFDVVTLTINIPSEYNAKMLTTISDTVADLSKYIVKVPALDTSNIRNMNSTFYGCSALTEVPPLNTSNVTTMNSTFYGCSSLTSIPLLTTSNVTSMSNIFKNCTSLVNVPVFNTSALINMTNMFSGCTNLSNNSLNNILAMCINATSFGGVKTLRTLGLTSAQATICQGLDNYQVFIDAGWTTGY